MLDVSLGPRVVSQTLFHAYWVDGVDVSDGAWLSAHASKLGLDPRVYVLQDSSLPRVWLPLAARFGPCSSTLTASVRSRLTASQCSLISQLRLQR